MLFRVREVLLGEYIVSDFSEKEDKFISNAGLDTEWIDEKRQVLHRNLAVVRLEQVFHFFCGHILVNQILSYMLSAG